MYLEGKLLSLTLVNSPPIPPQAARQTEAITILYMYCVNGLDQYIWAKSPLTQETEINWKESYWNTMISSLLDQSLLPCSKTLLLGIYHNTMAWVTWYTRGYAI